MDICRRRLEDMPFDHVFSVDGNDELCQATGDEVLIGGTWWNEYVDKFGEFHYGN